MKRLLRDERSNTCSRAASLARVAFAGLALLATMAAAWANDTMAEFAMGGLRFKSDPDVAMRAEDLFISTKEVRVAYTFFNTSKEDKTALVAFPMPDIVGSEADNNSAVPTENAANLFDFHVTADGVAVPLHLETSVTANGHDETARLRSLKIPLMPLGAATTDALDRLPKATRATFVSLGLGRIETYGTTDEMEDHLVANWTLRTAFTWTQTFPAGREIHLVQTYKPSVGGISQTSIGGRGWAEPDKGDYLRKYCLDQTFFESILRARAKTDQDMAPFAEQRIAYVLKTGANWAGPIGDFRLVVDKGETKNLVSFCGADVKKISATQYEMRKSRFTPTKDFYVLILTPLE